MARRLEHLLESGARNTPDAHAAVNALGDAMSYEKLDGFANRICEVLQALGVKGGDRVGVSVRKNLAAMATLFGAMKAGAAYVPTDVSAPVARNGYIFADCAVRAIVVEASIADQLAAEIPEVAWVRASFPAMDGQGADFVILARPREVATEPSPYDLAYILYTSGSTGQPKGVMHTHATAFAFIDWCSAEFDVRAEDRFSSHAPFHFDLSILDLYVPLMHGAAVVLIDSEAGKKPGVLAEIIETHRITVWYSTPSILRMLVEYGELDKRDHSALRLVHFAGEVFPIKHLRALMAAWPHPTYYNLYGPTETNVCTYLKAPNPLPLEQEAPLSIGGKCSGDDTLVVDTDGRVCASGEPGELVVTGGSVMPGYWNLPQRNREAFLTIDGRQWYCTGDIVREDTPGQYIFQGRRDRMVKRRGFRIELGEIEAALHKHPEISEAAVIADSSPDGEVAIRAFLASSETIPPSLIKLKQYCARNLPKYMAPDTFTVMNEIPKTSTDKIDYQRLRAMI